MIHVKGVPQIEPVNLDDPYYRIAMQRCPWSFSCSKKRFFAVDTYKFPAHNLGIIVTDQNLCAIKPGVLENANKYVFHSVAKWEEYSDFIYSQV